MYTTLSGTSWLCKYFSYGKYCFVPRAILRSPDALVMFFKAFLIIGAIMETFFDFSDVNNYRVIHMVLFVKMKGLIFLSAKMI